MCVDGGASLHTSHRQLKQWAREITAAEPSFDAQKPLKWSSTPLIFDAEDHPDRTTAVGCLPLLVSPAVEDDPLCPVVQLSSKRHGQCDLPLRLAPPRIDPLKRARFLEVSIRNLQPFDHNGRDQVQTDPAVRG